MARRVDHVQAINVSIARFIIERDALRLDGNAAFAFEVHRIQHLRLHLTCFQSATMLDETIGQRGFAVIDVGDDGKISNLRLVHGCVRGADLTYRARI